MISLTQ